MTSEQRDTDEALLGALAAHGTHAALICPDDGRSLSGDEVASVLNELAGALYTLGVRRGDRVAIVLGNGPELIELLFALAALGAAAAPLNPAYTTPEFAFFLADLAPRLVIVAGGDGAAAREAAGDVAVVDIVVRAGEHPALSVHGHQPAAASSFESGTPDDVALLLHTSGTTSRPKQVPLLQRNLMASARSTANHYKLGATDVSYCAMPLFHVHGIVGSTLAQLVAGGSVITPRRFTGRRFWPQAETHAATWLSGSPTFLQIILSHAGDERVETLRFVRSCSSALSPEVMERAEQGFGVPVLEAYGMTEASHQMTSNPLPPAPRTPGSVGVSAGAMVRIVDELWSDAPAGALGEVIVSGPGITPGYLGNEAANKSSFRDGWFRTGDQGLLQDGYLYLKGRLKEMIIRGGENISPAEVDEVLLAHSAVGEAVSFGVDDEKYGQEVEAAVTLSAPVTAQELRAHCRDSLAAFKIPRKIHVVDAIPKTATGKVQRRLVAAELSHET